MTETTEPKHEHPPREAHEACQACQTEALTCVLSALEWLDGEGSSARRAELLDWFKNVDVRASSVSAFLGYANAIGCTTTYTWGTSPEGRGEFKPEDARPIMPLLTVGFLLASIADDNRYSVHARVSEIIGTDEQYALAEFKRRFA